MRTSESYKINNCSFPWNDELLNIVVFVTSKLKYKLLYKLYFVGSNTKLLLVAVVHMFRKYSHLYCSNEEKNINWCSSYTSEINNRDNFYHFSGFQGTSCMHTSCSWEPELILLLNSDKDKNSYQNSKSGCVLLWVSFKIKNKIK